MAVNSFASYKEYFENLVAKNKALKSFYLGDSERIISKQRSEIEYPCLWLESPSIPFRDAKSDNPQADFIAAFSILSNVATDDEAAQDQAMQDNFLIAIEVISRMIRDRRGRSDDPMFNLDINSIHMDPINSMMVDNDYGYRVEFKLNNNINLCYDSSKWEV
jgi:hypothetical protein